METVTNAASSVASTASNLLWGSKPNEQSGTEPRAGETGTSTEPYDAGNVDGVPGNPGQNNSGSTTGGIDSTTNNSASTTGGIDSTTNNSASGNFGSTAGDTYSKSHSSNTENTSSGNYDAGVNNSNPASQTTTGAVDGPGAEVNQRESGSTNTGGFSTTEPSVSADPSSGQTPQHKQQGADKPLDEPESGVGKKALSPEEEEKQRGERALANKSPDDHSGEPLRIHDDAHEAEMKKTDRSKSLGQEGGGEHGKQQGTGEQHVKTSGLQADGGDFDATKPGAGREADRLLEQKGIKKSDSNKGPPAEVPGETSNTSGTKVSKMDKLKEKLHIGSKKE